MAASISMIASNNEYKMALIDSLTIFTTNKRNNLEYFKKINSAMDKYIHFK